VPPVEANTRRLPAVVSPKGEEYSEEGGPPPKSRHGSHLLANFRRWKNSLNLEEFAARAAGETRPREGGPGTPFCGGGRDLGAGPAPSPRDWGSRFGKGGRFPLTFQENQRSGNLSRGRSLKQKATRNKKTKTPAYSRKEESGLPGSVGPKSFV